MNVSGRLLRERIVRIWFGRLKRGDPLKETVSGFLMFENVPELNGKFVDIGVSRNKSARNHGTPEV
jgi:hypothetical protein